MSLQLQIQMNQAGGVVVQACNPSSQQVDFVGLSPAWATLRLPGKPGLQEKFVRLLSQTNNKQTNQKNQTTEVLEHLQVKELLATTLPLEFSEREKQNLLSRGKEWG